ncbi:hypothetical protein JOH51_004400 [Rhizobium leguminosarum]|nr:hypothetical protein [Rhizobium leguminosarum]
MSSFLSLGLLVADRPGAAGPIGDGVAHIGGTTPFPADKHLMGDGAGGGLFGGHEDDGAGSEIILGCRGDGHDRRAVRNGNLLFLAVIGDGDRPAVDALDGVCDGGIGHAALRLEIPAVAAFSGAFHGRREDQHLERPVTAALFRQRGDADEITRLDVCDIGLGDARKFPAVGEGDIDARPLARLHREGRASVVDDAAPDMNLFGLLVLGMDRHG